MQARFVRREKGSTGATFEQCGERHQDKQQQQADNRAPKEAACTGQGGCMAGVACEAWVTRKKFVARAK